MSGILHAAVRQNVKIYRQGLCQVFSFVFGGAVAIRSAPSPRCCRRWMNRAGRLA